MRSIIAVAALMGLVGCTQRPDFLELIASYPSPAAMCLGDGRTVVQYGSLYGRAWFTVTNEDKLISINLPIGGGEIPHEATLLYRDDASGVDCEHWNGFATWSGDRIDITADCVFESAHLEATLRGRYVEDLTDQPPSSM